MSAGLLMLCFGAQHTPSAREREVAGNENGSTVVTLVDDDMDMGPRGEELIEGEDEEEEEAEKSKAEVETGAADEALASASSSAVCVLSFSAIEVGPVKFLEDDKAMAAHAETKNRMPRKSITELRGEREPVQGYNYQRTYHK